MSQAPNAALAPYASHSDQTRAQTHRSARPTRSEYQRDRDRIVHSTAFRRLVYKTKSS